MNGTTTCEGIAAPKMVLVPGLNYLQLTRTGEHGPCIYYITLLPDTHYTGTWVPRSSMSIGRKESAAFTIGAKAYVVGGRSSTYAYLDDCWEWDQLTDTWTQKADIPIGRANGIGFSANNKGYIGLGYGNSVVYDDIWEWDPTSNTWTQKNSFPAGTRTGAIATTIGNDVYAGLGASGNNTLMSDFWKYDAINDSWIQCSNFGGTSRRDANTFTINNKLYVCGGCSTPQSAHGDNWEYDPALDQWTQKESVPRNVYNGSTFTLNNNGYLACAREEIHLSSFFHSRNVYEYDPTTDTWQNKHVLPGQPRSEAIGFSIGNYGYVVGGISDHSFSSELLEFTP